MPEQPVPAVPPSPIDPKVAKAAEEHFLSLVQSSEGAYYVGRWLDLAPDQYRALFGLALAALKSAHVDHGLEAMASVPPPSLSGEGQALATLSEQPAEQRLEAMMAALVQRDERIRELQQALKKTTQGN